MEKIKELAEDAKILLGLTVMWLSEKLARKNKD